MKDILGAPCAEASSGVRDMEAESNQAGEHRHGEYGSRETAPDLWRQRTHGRRRQSCRRHGGRHKHDAIVKSRSVVFGGAIHQNARRQCCRRCIEQPRSLERRRDRRSCDVDPLDERRSGDGHT
jgi:hypothetical protein